MLKGLSVASLLQYFWELWSLLDPLSGHGKDLGSRALELSLGTGWNNQILFTLQSEIIGCVTLKKKIFLEASTGCFPWRQECNIQ